MKFVRSSKIVNGKMRYYFGKQEVSATEWARYWAKHKPRRKGAAHVFIPADFSTRNGGKGERMSGLACNIFDQSRDCHIHNYKEGEAKVAQRGWYVE